MSKKQVEVKNEQDYKENIYLFSDVISKSIKMLSDYNEGIIEDKELNHSDLIFKTKLKMSDFTYNIIEKLLGEKLDKVNFGEIDAVLRNTEIITEVAEVKNGIIECAYEAFIEKDNKLIDLKFAINDDFKVLDLNIYPIYQNEVNVVEFEGKTNKAIIKQITDITNTSKKLRSVVDIRSKDMTVEEWLKLPVEYSNMNSNETPVMEDWVSKAVFANVQDDHATVMYLEKEKEKYAELVRAIDSSISKLKDKNVKRFKIKK